MTRAVHRPVGFAGYASVSAAVWSGGFTALHAYWALGGRGFLGSGPQVDAAFARTGFTVYNGVITLLCLVGLAAAAGLAVETRLPHRVVRAARVGAWTACVLLLVRGGVGVGQGLLGLAPPPDRLAAYDFDPWFLLGGVLFGIAAGVGRRRSAGSDDG